MITSTSQFLSYRMFIIILYTGRISLLGYMDDAFVKSRSHTKITEITKKNLNNFNVPFFVALWLRVKI